MDDPGPESFGDQADLPRILETKQKAAIAFHKANQDLALRAAAKMNSLSVTGFYTGSLKLKNLTPSGGEDLLWSLQLRPASTKATMIYWVVHGSSLVRATKQQLRHETVPECYERQAKPGAENDLQRPLAERILAALRPVRGPVRGLDLASRAQTPDDFPSLGGWLFHSHFRWCSFSSPA